ncbi:2-oxo acid dehydrogenase subunit E2 [Thermomicrobiaceae bacterium CFH 74404]|uniref:Dihydrolipoamide acetyltransferase component of pyruvate dehydrogenase complex n=1 Tax=Thermalbibacter longus TaxID=2951981 RepID=A0AA41WCE0_9BACT|nr:dihydrolipoamide acetyltransferase family protein [Thermalbibacter longus]MCM8749377.1 2-oxo acid dehydrogenase subunit E2 [Thermalbibacter longus]
MPKELIFPELAESVVEGTIVKWLVEEGERLAKDQPYIEITTDKVTVELPSPYEGVLVKKLVAEGDTVPVHTPLALIAEEQGVAVSAPRADEAPTATAPGPSPEADGSAALALFKPDETQQETIRNPFLAAGSAVAEAPPEPGRVRAAPAVRRLARELQIDLSQVPGSGPHGRVRIEDVRAYAARLRARPEVPPEMGPAAPAEEEAAVVAPAMGPAIGAPAAFPAPPVYRTPKGYEHLEERVPLSAVRRAIAQQMVASHLYTVRTLAVDEADLTELVRLREQLKPEAERQGVKLSYLPFIFKAVVRALKKYPQLNASLDESRGEIVRKRYYNMGMAVATEHGLMVPVVKDVDRKSVLELAAEIEDLAERARSGKLKLEEVTGSTFSVTNIGPIGSLFSFPIINVPDAAILGVHSIKKRPVAMPDDTIALRQMMYLSLSFDHRLVDGAEAVQFLKEVIRLLERPELFVLEAV